MGNSPIGVEYAVVQTTCSSRPMLMVRSPSRTICIRGQLTRRSQRRQHFRTTTRGIPRMNRLIAALGAAGLMAAGTLLLGGTASAAAADTATVSVVHGIPDTPVNVFVNGKSTLAGFKPLTVAGPLELPAGSYDVKVYPAADTAGTGTPVIQASATLTAG